MKVDSNDLLALRNIPRNLGSWLYDRRQVRGITLREAARQLGISAPFLSDVEHDRRRVTDERLPEFARVYGCSVKEIEAARCELDAATAKWIGEHPRLVEWLRRIRADDESRPLVLRKDRR